MTTVLQKLKEFGESIGLTGEGLQKFIKEQQIEEREQRALEREREQQEKAWELERMKLQLEQHRLQQEARDKEAEAELQKLKLERTRISEEADADADQTNRHAGLVNAKMPKMPYFDEDKDCMDAYLNRFERFAEVQRWKKDTYAVCLSALLKGKALEVYARLPIDQANDYDSLKAALLKRFQLSEDGFKRKFRTAKPDTGESPAQFITRLASYLQRWVELAKVDQTYEGLSVLIIREQYLSICPPDLALFLKERSLKDLDELATIAERYYEAHTETFAAKQRSSDVRVNTKGPKKCYKCGSETHLAKTCSRESRLTSTDVKRSPSKTTTFPRSCFICGKSGHLARNCFQRVKTAGMEFKDHESRAPQDHRHQSDKDTSATHPKNADSHVCNALLSPEIELKCGCKLPVIADSCFKEGLNRMPVTYGSLAGKRVSVLRDTGCSTVVVRRSLVPEHQLTGHKAMCVLIDGTVRRTPVAHIDIKSPYLSGTVKAVCMDQPLYDVIIGNVEGVNDFEVNRDIPTTESEITQEDDIKQSNAVLTRQQKKLKVTKPLHVPTAIDTSMSVNDIVKLQGEDETLNSVRQQVQPYRKSERQDETYFFLDKQLLYRQHQEKKGVIRKQLVLPKMMRSHVMKIAHESTMAGHQGVSRTLSRVTTQFWWPGVTRDVYKYCRSCDICQRTIPKGKNTKLSLGSVPLIDTPFKRVAVDLIGPMFPVTDRGNRYVLTLVDYATRYPEATPLKNIDTETVAEALVSMFSRIGIPEEILSDQGAQFMSNVMKEVSRLLSVKQLTTTPYHPQCNGLVERFNGTLKTMLKRMCAERPKDWDRYVDPLLFSYREVPQESIGFSPFEMLYGHPVRGPMTILKQLWTREQQDPDVKTTYEYVINLRQRLQDTCDLAHDALQKAQQKQKKYFDSRAKDRFFKPGDKVLLLLPTDGNKLLMHWKGPFEIKERVNDKDYIIQLHDKTRLFHANLLKKYWEREDSTANVESVGAAILEPEEDDGVAPVEILPETEENYTDVYINPELSDEQIQDVKELLREYHEIFTNVPKVTKLGEHQITLTTDEPIRGKAYPLPHAMKELLNKEIDYMMKMDIIEPSNASYASPVVLVKKPDGSTRVCVDYRQLNKVTVFDPEPITSAEEIFAKLAGDRYHSKFDLTKGYWQIPMNEDDKDLTTFICHRGLFRFKVMPFGLVNAPATFSRIMRRLLRESCDLDNYLDDVLAHTKEWTGHLLVLRDFFERVKSANLSLRPSKCEVGQFRVSFLGHHVTENALQPRQETVDKILNAPRPTNKKELRAFLGLVGFYRRFIPNFATVASPLTDATRKGAPNRFEFSDAQIQSFEKLQQHIVNPPILRLADLQRTFILQTDASDTGVGAVLLQEDDEAVKHPVAFASRKLLPRETRYSTIEKECLAIIWGITKFQEYLYGKEFILETDHHPLQYLGKAQYQNGRLMRWALALQPYRFVIKAIHGRENVGADFLSRAPCVDDD